MRKLQAHHSDDQMRNATVWHSTVKSEFYVELDDSGRQDYKFFSESEAEDCAEEYVLGELTPV